MSNYGNDQGAGGASPYGQGQPGQGQPDLTKRSEQPTGASAAGQEGRPQQDQQYGQYGQAQQ